MLQNAVVEETNSHYSSIQLLFMRKRM